MMASSGFRPAFTLLSVQQDMRSSLLRVPLQSLAEDGLPETRGSPSGVVHYDLTQEFVKR